MKDFITFGCNFLRDFLSSDLNPPDNLRFSVDCTSDFANFGRDRDRDLERDFGRVGGCDDRFRPLLFILMG